MKTYTQILSLLIGGIALILTMQTSAESLREIFQAAKGGKYVSPTIVEVKIAEKLFLRILQGEQSSELQNAWERQGFIMRTVTHRRIPFTIVQEMKTKRTGRGFYLFRQTKSLPIALQSPHTFKDSYTRQIGRKLMRDGHYAAFAWNTVPRNKADLAHIENTIFQAFSRAFARQYPAGTIVQLHGFERQKRKSRRGKETDMVLSNTFNTPSERVLMTYQCLKSKMTRFKVITDQSPPRKLKISLYPYELNDLGGRGNSNAQDLLYHFDFKNFVHIEMSRPLRKKIRHRIRVRRKFNACLQARSFSAGPIITSNFSRDGDTRVGYDLLWMDTSQIFPESPENLLWRVKGRDKLMNRKFSYERDKMDVGIRLQRETKNQQDVWLTLRRRVPVSTGTEISLTGMIRLGGDADVVLQLSWYSKVRRGKSTGRVTKSISLPSNGLWYPFSIDAIIPGDVMAVRPYFKLSPPEKGTATVDFDNLRLIAWGRSSTPLQATGKNQMPASKKIQKSFSWATALLPGAE